jgi:hypothetical protein
MADTAIGRSENARGRGLWPSVAARAYLNSAWRSNERVSLTIRAPEPVIRLRSHQGLATIDGGDGACMGVLVMMLRALTVAALTLAGSGIACAQSIYLYVAPGASVYVAPAPNGAYSSAPAVYPGAYLPGAYGPPPVAVPLPAPVHGPEVAPEPYLESAPADYVPTYAPPLRVYGAAPGLIMQRRLDQAPRPQALIPSGRRGTLGANRIAR